MNFSRSTILVAAAALLAACGDKVTVTQYTPPATVAKVYSVDVAPATATVTTGASLTFTAAVNADAGVATTVTWSASAGTITSAGVFTAPSTASAGVAVCATSTVDTGKKGCATVVVQAAAAVVPATISINSIQVTGAVGGATVNPAAVAGGIDVTLNVNPGNQTVSKVVLIVGGIRTDSQTFSAAQAAAMRYAADEAIANQTIFPQIVFSVNTAKFNATTGVPTWLNGNQAVSAQMYTTQGGSTTAASATAQTNLTFANVDGFAITQTFPNTAVDAAGYRWAGNGSLTINALPVIYSGATLGTVNAALVANGGCGALGAIGSATTKTGNVYVITGALAGLQSGAACATTTPNLVGITATNATGDNLTLAGATGVIGAQAGVRWDNVAPLAPIANTIQAAILGAARVSTNPAGSMPNGRRNQWLNDAVTFNGLASSTATSTSASTANALVCDNANAGDLGNCPVVGNLGAAAGAGGTNGTKVQNAVFSVTAPLDNATGATGVGGVTYSMNVAAVSVGSAGTAATAAAGSALTSATTLAASANSTTYCGVLFATDALGNKSAANPIGSTSTSCTGQQTNGNLNIVVFGVDRAAPQISYDDVTTPSIAANARIGTATIAGNFAVTVNDTGLVGNSGMLPSAPVRMLLNFRPNGTAACLGPAGAVLTTCSVTSTGVVAAAPIYRTAINAITGVANYGYYTFNATAFDAAGNTASVSPRVMVFDATAPVPGATSTPLTVTATGFTASALINEDLDIQDYFTTVAYAAAPVLAPALIRLQPNTVVNSYNAATFLNTNYAISQTISLPLALQANVAAGLTNLTGIQFTVRSQSNLAAANAAGAPVTITPGTAIPTAVAPANMTAFPAVALPAGVTGVVTGNTTAAAAATPASTTLTANVTGNTATFVNPFSRVDFYALDATGTWYYFIGSVSSASLNDNGATRTYSYALTVNGATLYSTLGGAGATFGTQIIALGINSTGTIGMVPAALTALAITF